MKSILLALIPQIIPLAFFILASITVPTITKLYLAKDSDGTIYGIFGYCTSDSKCTTPSIHTTLSNALTPKILSSNVVDTLSPYLITTPIAAGLTFFSILFNLSSLIFNSSLDYSNIYWIFSIIISTLAFIASALSSVFTFLLFYPYVGWLAWCLIPSAVINFANIIIISISFKFAPSIDDIDEESYINNDNNEKTLDFDSSNDFYRRIDLDSNEVNNIPGIDLNKSTFLSNSVMSSSSSISTNKDKDKKDSLIVTEKVNTQNSLSSLSLKVPNISNPYVDDQNSNNSVLNQNISMDTDDNYGNQLVHGGNKSDVSLNSNFTSISQRPINPNYYTNVPTKPRLPFNSANQYNSNQPRPNQNYPQQYRPQRQNNYHQYQNQMPSMPAQNRNAYMRNPVAMVHGPNHMPNHMPNQNYNMSLNRQNIPNNQYQQQFNSFNPYVPAPPAQGNNRFVPMRHRAQNKMSNIPPPALSNEGPYSGFR